MSGCGFAALGSVVEGLSNVRLIGVDTPNPDQPPGDGAREFTASNLVDKEVVLEFDAAPVDRCGRLLAHAYLPDERMFNELLVEKGHAQVATFLPNTRHARLFRSARAGARPPRGPLGAPAANSVVRNDAPPGVLKLDLTADSYKWRFLPVAGKTFTDSGASRCH